MKLFKMFYDDSEHDFFPYQRASAFLLRMVALTCWPAFLKRLLLSLHSTKTYVNMLLKELKRDACLPTVLIRNDANLSRL